MKKALKFLSLGLALVMCMSMAVTPAFAATYYCQNCNTEMSSGHFAMGGLCEDCYEASQNSQNATSDGENKVNVTLTIDETYTVKIPKTLVLDAESKSADYEVQVSGNIAGTKQVKVTPDATFLLSQDGKADVTATITQEVQAVKSAEIEGGAVVTLDGNIKALDATSGEWNGSFNFVVSLETEVN